MYNIYVLKSEIAEKSYVGITNDIARRLSEHNLGKSRFTKRFMPWKLIHEELCSTRSKASKREKYLKSASGRRFLRKKLFVGY